MSNYRYAVKLHGRDHAQFVFAKDAERYIDAITDPDNKVARRVDSHKRGPNALLYEREAYAIEEAVSGRRVKGTTSHGNAILEALDRAEGKA